MTDIDIDTGQRENILALFKTIKAVNKYKLDGVDTSPTGVYFQNIPINPFYDQPISALDKSQAADLGFFKIDILNVNLYHDIRDNIHMNELYEREPNWSLLQKPEVVEQLFHLNNYFWLLEKMKPTTIMQLAMCLALIRPGKKHLIDLDWCVIEKTIWEPTEEYYFKKSHAIAYANIIKVHLNLIEDKINRQSS